MMKINLIIILFFITLSCFSQETSNNLVTNETIYDTQQVGLIPEFVGGADAFNRFFKDNYKTPNVPQLIGKIFMSFVVEIDGTLTDIKTIKDIGFGTGSEAERVLNLSPKWYPGTKDDKAVRVLYTMAIPIQTE